MVPSFHADRLVSDLFYHTIITYLNLCLFSGCLTKVHIDLAADEYDRRVAGLLIKSLLITLQKTGHGGAYFDWLMAQGQWVRFGVLFLIKGAINHSHTSEMRRCFRKGHFHGSKGYQPFSLSKRQSEIATNFIKNVTIADFRQGDSGVEFAHSRCVFKVHFSCVFAGCSSTRWQSSPNTFHSSHKLDRVCVAAALLSSSVSSFQCLHPPSCIHLSSSFVNSSQRICSD